MHVQFYKKLQNSFLKCLYHFVFLPAMYPVVLHLHQHLILSLFFSFIHFSRYVVIVHDGYSLHFILVLKSNIFSCVYLSPLHPLWWSVSWFCPFSDWVVCLSTIQLWEFFIYSRYVVRYMIFRYFPQSYHPLNRIFHRANVLNSDEDMFIQFCF